MCVMKYHDLPRHEESFFARGVAIGKKYTMEQKNIPILGEYYKLRPKVNQETPDYYEDAKFTKDQIVIHFTQGYLKGDVNQLFFGSRNVSTPFLIARDGTIYSLFPSSRWSYHLGPGAVGGNTVRSRSTVAVEFSNIGPLDIGTEPDSNILYDTYGNEYCNAIDQEAYSRLDYPFRSKLYFATLTEAQYNSGKRLLNYLTDKYNIPYEFLPEPERFAVYESVLDFKGIVSHVNYRVWDAEHPKWDMGPAFDWNNLKE